MAGEAEKFDRKVREIIRKILAHEESSVKAALRLLDQVRREIIAEIAVGGSEFDLSVARQVKRAIEEQIKRLQTQLETQFKQSLAKSGELGRTLVDEPAVTIGTRSAFGLNPQLVQVAAEFSLGYVKGLTQDAERSILRVLQRSALGGVPVSKAIEEIGKSLRSKGVFKSLAGRAETILRTELGRIQSIATHVRMLERRDAMARAGYRLRKSWMTARDDRVRTTHRLIDGQVKEVDEPFLVPITLVGEETEDLMYPRDPAGSAMNTINCRCAVKPVVEKAVVSDQ